MILRLVWSPFSLARIAAKTTTRRAVIAAFLAISLEFGVVHSVATARAVTRCQHRHMGAYVASPGVDALFFGLRCGAYSPFLAMPFVLAVLANAWFLNKNTKGDPTKRVLLLSPVSLLLPVIVWSACLLLWPVQHPYLGPGAGKPNWVLSSLIPVACKAGPLVVFAFLLATVAVALRRIPAVNASMGTPSRGRCGHNVTDRGGEDSGMYCRGRGCGYNLHGLTENRCPECGRPFDPNDPGSFHRSPPLGPFAEWCLRPMGPLSFALIGVPSALLLYVAVDPGFYYMGDVVSLFLLWVGSAFVGFVWMALRLPVVLYHRQPVSWIMRNGRQWVGVASILVATTLLIGTRTPLRIGFLTALPGLTDLVNTTDPRQDLAISPPRACGLYVIGSRYCTNIPGCIKFVLGGYSETYFIYSPDGIDSLAYNPGVKGHLLGDWYWMVED